MSGYVEVNNEWKTMDESDERWNEHLHQYKLQFLQITLANATPCFLIFMYSVVNSVFYGGWWNTSMGEPYVPHEPYSGDDVQNPYRTYVGIPSVLNMHMWFAVMMLILIVVQIGSMWLATKGGLASMNLLHKKLGPFTAFVILLASGLGTISLALCDIQPKRGAENLFFVCVGTCICVSLFKGVYCASRGLYGLHFQYMSFCVGLVFSPGWNRIISLTIRKFQEHVHGISQECFVINTWAQHGYLYVWSFIAGVVSMGFWWVVAFKAPIFKTWSSGFNMLAVLAAALVACIWQTFYARIVYGDPLVVSTQCTSEDHFQWVNFTSAMRTQALFTASKGYGVCSANLWQSPQGTFITENWKVMRMQEPGLQFVGYS